MKIIKTPDSQNEKKIAKARALEGCNVCPYCGETKEYFDPKRLLESIINNIPFKYDGIECLGEFLHGSIFTFFKGLFVTRYKCHTCGAEWESEPYKI